MSQNISQLEAIIELLHLKRQHQEAQLSQSKRQDERLGVQIETLTVELEGVKRQIIQDYVNAQSNQRLEVWTAAHSA